MYQLASPGELGSFYNNNNKVVRSTSSDSITTTSSSTDDANTASIGNSNSNAHSSGFGGLFRRYRSRNPAARSVESNNNNNNNHEASSSSNFFDRGDDELHGYLKLKKKGSFGTTWKKFYFRLSTSMDIVSWYASELDLNVIDEVNLTNAHVMRAEGMTNKPYSFGIFVPNSSPLFLQADSQQQMEQWITSIEARTKKNSDSSTNSSVLRKAMDAMLEACVASNEHGIIVAWNKAAEQLFGWTAEEAIGKNVSILMPSPYSDTHDALLMNYRRTGNKRLIGKPRKLFGLRKDGSTFNIELSLGEVESQLNHAHSQVTEEEKAKQPRWIAIFRDLSVHHNNNNNNNSNNVKTDQTSWSSCEESVKRDSLRLEIPLDVNTTTTTTTNDGLHHGLHSFHDGSFSSTGCPVMHSINLTSNGITSAPHPLPHAYHYGNDGNHNNRSRPGSDDHLESLNYARGFLNQLLHQHMDQFAGTMGVVIEELYEKLEEMHQQVEIMSTENHRLMDCLVAKTREVEDLQAELQEWKKGDVSNFEKLLKDDDAFAAYLEFATKESNQENLLFWREAERFKSIVFIKDLQEKAMEIYETYVREGAPRCLNTTKAMRDQVLSHLKDPSRELFTPLQTTVLKNMRMDSFARFQQTPKGKAIAAKFMTEKD